MTNNSSSIQYYRVGLTLYCFHAVGWYGSKYISLRKSNQRFCSELSGKNGKLCSLLGKKIKDDSLRKLHYCRERLRIISHRLVGNCEFTKAVTAGGRIIRTLNISVVQTLKACSLSVRARVHVARNVCRPACDWLTVTVLSRSGMLDVVHMWNDEVEAFYSDQIVNQKRIYSQRFGSRTRLIFVIIVAAVPACIAVVRYDTIRYDILFALKNWQASCQFNLAHELKEN